MREKINCSETQSVGARKWDACADVDGRLNFFKEAVQGLVEVRKTYVTATICDLGTDHSGAAMRSPLPRSGVARHALDGEWRRPLLTGCPARRKALLHFTAVEMKLYPHQCQNDK